MNFKTIAGAGGLLAFLFAGTAPAATLTQTTSAGTMAYDLTALGGIDWAYFDEASTVSVPSDKKSGSPGQIAVTKVGAFDLRSSEYNGTFAIAWSDGTNTANAGGRNGNMGSGAAVSAGDGISSPIGADEGFRIVVPADTETRTLTLALRELRAKGTLSATLSDGSAAPITWDNGVGEDALASGNRYLQATIEYAAASAGQTLTVDWIYADGNRTYSTVAIGGIALSDGTPPDPPPSNLEKPLVGLDFNRDDQFASPSQARFRVISGSAASQGANSASYTKTVGPYQITVSQPDATNFEFRGANHDSSRAIPGGDVSMAFLVADFIATRKGAIDLAITGLPAGDYYFRSYHLDTFTGSGLGFAQGAATTTPNTIEARLGDGPLRASVLATALGSSGLNTTYINNNQVPTLGFAFTHDGVAPLSIHLTSTQPNGANNYLLLNGFGIFPANP